MAPTLFTSCNALPPEGAVLAWGGPARRTSAPTLATACAARGLAGRGSRDASPLSPVQTCSSRFGAAGSSPSGAGLAWGGPARRPLAPTLVAARILFVLAVLALSFNAAYAQSVALAGIMGSKALLAVSYTHLR